ncbi:MAG: hypothetical protein LKE85_10635 [Lachnospiraceae bacterium]|jgi:DNA repair exonuclease SbcCD ATPase subunit|nr:hypothetical protein [Lachnospiraceae bacterium]
MSEQDQVRRMGKRALVEYCARLQELQKAKEADLLAQKEAALTALSKDYEDKIGKQKEQHEKELLSLQSAFQDKMNAREAEITKKEQDEAEKRRQDAQHAEEAASALQAKVADLTAQNQALQKELAEKEAKYQEAEKALSDRTIRLEQAGTIAEAAFDLNNVLTDAQNAAKQYLDSIQALEQKKKEELDRVNQDAKAELDRQREETKAACDALVAKTNAECEAKRQETETACRAREEQAEKTLAELKEKVQEVLNARSGLDSFLSGIDAGK